MNLFDVVALKSNFTEGGLVKGQKGTILEVYNPKCVEVEFSDKKGITIYLGSFCKDDLDLICSNEPKSYIRDML